ncbi:MAG: ECF-type sigma factor [Planctomycetota bacterium]|jgi:RNA polymerase sigma factor (TIGR02999 family)
MNPIPSHDITLMLSRVTAGDHAAVDELMPLVYDELRSLAERYLWSERVGHTLQATAIVNEAYLRLVGTSERSWQNRAHFFATAATAIRLILVDHARRRGRLKRGGDRDRIALHEAEIAAVEADDRMLVLDEALSRLAEIDAQKARVVELRFFTGLTVDEVASVLEVSSSTVARDWRLARAWLRCELAEAADDGP